MSLANRAECNFRIIPQRMYSIFPIGIGFEFLSFVKTLVAEVELLFIHWILLYGYRVGCLHFQHLRLISTP